MDRLDPNVKGTRVTGVKAPILKGLNIEGINGLRGLSEKMKTLNLGVGYGRPSPEALKRQEEMLKGMRRRARVPFETRDVLIEMNRQLVEMREEDAKREAGARRRDAWMLVMTAAILVLTALVALDVFSG
jgi:hypothetical protein